MKIPSCHLWYLVDRTSSWNSGTVKKRHGKRLEDRFPCFSLPISVSTRETTLGQVVRSVYDASFHAFHRFIDKTSFRGTRADASDCLRSTRAAQEWNARTSVASYVSNASRSVRPRILRHSKGAKSILNRWSNKCVSASISRELKPREFQLQSAARNLCENLSRRFFAHRGLTWWIESVLPRNSKEVCKFLWIYDPRSFRESINRNRKADEFEKVIRLVGDFILRVYKIISRSLNSTV